MYSFLDEKYLIHMLYLLMDMDNYNLVVVLYTSIIWGVIRQIQVAIATVSMLL